MSLNIEEHVVFFMYQLLRYLILLTQKREAKLLYQPLSSLLFVKTSSRELFLYCTLGNDTHHENSTSLKKQKWIKDVYYQKKMGQ